MSEIKVEVVQHTTCSEGFEVVTFLVTFPRIILPEVLTHRAFSRNTSSSRAVPFKKLVQAVQENPFIPIGWQKHHTGMQGFEYIEDEEEIDKCRKKWLESRDKAVEQAIELHQLGVTKQLCNRILEPYAWTTMIITTTLPGLLNFFELRCSKYNENKDNISTAEIHIQDLANKMRSAYFESEKTVDLKIANDYHIPFLEKIWKLYPDTTLEEKIKISISMCARVSYTVIEDNKLLSKERHLELYDLLLKERHMSPFEHVAKVSYYLDEYKEQNELSRNFVGFEQYRAIVERKLLLD